MTEPKPRYDAGAVKAVEIRAELRQIKSMVDHTYNLTISIPEDCKSQAQILLGWILDEVHILIEKEN